MADKIEFQEEFERGKKDCQSSTPAEHNASRDYNRGYDVAYFQMEALTSLSLQRGMK